MWSLYHDACIDFSAQLQLTQDKLHREQERSRGLEGEYVYPLLHMYVVCHF